MSDIDNEELVRRVIETIWNRGELDVADELFAPDYVNRNGLIPDLVSGPEAIKFSVTLYRLAFPELHITVDALSGDGDTGSGRAWIIGLYSMISNCCEPQAIPCCIRLTPTSTR